MVTMLLLLLTLAGLFAAAEGQDVNLGKCPTPPVEENFDINKYLGKWYEIEKIPAIFDVGTCVQVNYIHMKDGRIVGKNQIQRFDGSVDQTESELTTARIAEPAKMRVSYSRLMHPAPYWVLATDYDNYALVYSCSNALLSLFHTDYAWILGRNSSLPQETITNLKGILTSADIDVDRMIATNQENCMQPV